MAESSLSKGRQGLDVGEGQPCHAPTQLPFPKRPFITGWANSPLLIHVALPQTLSLVPFTDQEAEAQRGQATFEGSHTLPPAPSALHTLPVL